MDDEGSAYTAIVWADASRAAIAGRVVKAAGLSVIAAGAPDVDEAASVADALGVGQRDDLRAVLAAESCSVFLLFSRGVFGTDPERRDGEAVLAAAQRGAVVASVEPLPISGEAVVSGGWVKGQEGSRAIDRVLRLPDAGHGVGFREAEELVRSLDAGFEAIRAASIRCCGRANEGSAGARLLDACELLVRFIGVPELVDAAFVKANARGEPASLRDLAGTFSIIARFADGRGASLTVSDRWSRHAREADFVLDDSVLVVRPRGFLWESAEGLTRDESGEPESGATWVEAAAGTVTAALSDTPRERRDPVRPLAIAEAALLSARTGQPESPETQLRRFRV